MRLFQTVRAPTYKEYGSGRSIEDVKDCFELANALSNSVIEIQDDTFRSILHENEVIATIPQNGFAFSMYYLFSQYSFPCVFLFEPGLDHCRICVGALLRFSRSKKSLVIICDEAYVAYRQTLLNELQHCAGSGKQLRVIYSDQSNVGHYVAQLQNMPKLALFGKGFCSAFLAASNFPYTKLLVNGPSVGFFERFYRLGPPAENCYSLEFEHLQTFENILRHSFDFFLETTSFFAFRSKNYQDYS